MEIRLNTSIRVFPQNGSFNDDYCVYSPEYMHNTIQQKTASKRQTKKGAVVDADGGISTVVVLPRCFSIPRLIFALEKHIKKGVKWKEYRFVEMETT